MRRLLLLLLLPTACLVALWPAHVRAFTALRTDGCTGGAVGMTTVSCSLADIDVDVGDVCVMIASVYNSAVITIDAMDDDQTVDNWTYRHRHTASPSGSGMRTEAWTAIATSGAATLVTMTVSASANLSMVGGCFSGSPATIQISGTNTGSTAAGQTHTPGSLTGVSGDLLVTGSVAATGFAFTANADYTVIQAGTRSVAQWKALSGNYTGDGAWSSAPTNEDTVSIHVLIRDGAATASSPRGTLLGVLP